MAKQWRVLRLDEEADRNATLHKESAVWRRLVQGILIAYDTRLGHCLKTKRRRRGRRRRKRNSARSRWSVSKSSSSITPLTVLAWRHNQLFFIHTPDSTFELNVCSPQRRRWYTATVVKVKKKRKNIFSSAQCRLVLRGAQWWHGKRQQRQRWLVGVPDGARKKKKKNGAYVILFICRWVGTLTRGALIYLFNTRTADANANKEKFNSRPPGETAAATRRSLPGQLTTTIVDATLGYFLLMKLASVFVSDGSRWLSRKKKNLRSGSVPRVGRSRRETCCIGSLLGTSKNAVGYTCFLSGFSQLLAATFLCLTQYT